MKHLLFSFITLSFLSISIHAQTSQKKVDPEHTNYYKPASADLDAVKIDIQDIVSKIEYTKFKIKISNTTTDYILYRPQESSFLIEGNKYSPEDKKTILIQPLDNSSRTIDAKGNGNNFHVDTYTYNLDGLYKVVPIAPPVVAPDFMLPASTNQFIAGDFKIELISVSKKTQETAAKFKVTYTGNGMGIVDPKNLSVMLDNGQVFANDKKDKASVLAKGESDTFTALFHIEGRIADMQFANMKIVWKDTFKNAELKKITGTSINFVLDPGMTAGKNK